MILKIYILWINKLVWKNKTSKFIALEFNNNISIDIDNIEKIQNDLNLMNKKIDLDYIDDYVTTHFL